VLQCVAVRCSVLQCAVVWCSVVQCIAVHCSALQCIAVHCSALQCIAVHCSALQCIAPHCSVLQCVAVSTHVGDHRRCYCSQPILLQSGLFVRSSIGWRMSYRCKLLLQNSYDTFHWKCHIPKIHQIQKVSFLSTNSDSLCICTTRYREI